MTLTIKALETNYAGCRFRSRLEARWAVFFDTLGIKWEYEKEGFKLPDGTYYLPDFWLMEMGLWFEVKPAKLDEKYGGFLWPEGLQVHELAEMTGTNSIVMCGAPGLDGNGNPTYEGFIHGDHCQLWCECQHCGVVGIEFCGYSDRLTHADGCEMNNPKYWQTDCPNPCWRRPRKPNFASPNLVKAYTAARSARFGT